MSIMLLRVDIYLITSYSYYIVSILKLNIFGIIFYIKIDLYKKYISK